MQKTLIVIPARLPSQRLPAKPLKDIGGKSLIQRVWEAAKCSEQANEVVIATDSLEIVEHAKVFGGNVVLTSETLESGSDRVVEAAKQLGYSAKDLIVNVQGDMPFIPYQLIDETILAFRNSNNSKNSKNSQSSDTLPFQMFSIAAPIYDVAELQSQDVKIALTEHHQALYFSRAPIPYARDGFMYTSTSSELKAKGDTNHSSGDASKNILSYRQFGLYLYSAEALSLYGEGKRPSPLENTEKLEQLRALEAGLRIGIHVFSRELIPRMVEVNTPEDLALANKIAKENKF